MHLDLFGRFSFSYGISFKIKIKDPIFEYITFYRIINSMKESACNWRIVCNPYIYVTPVSVLLKCSCESYVFKK